MKRSWIFSAMAVVVILTTLVAFTKDGNPLSAREQPEIENITPPQPEVSVNNNDIPKDITLTESQRKMCENNNDFACNLFRTISKHKHGSIVMSPISVSYLLGMLNEGADGETRRQITDVLGLNGSTVEEINEYFKKMMNQAPNVDSTVTIKTANCIDVNSAMDIRLTPQYEADMLKYYNAQVDALDFRKGSSLTIINSWCDTHTDGMIPSILTPAEFQPDAAMYLLNAVYFNASWTKDFDPEETRKMVFTKQNGTTVKRKMMHLKTKAAYGKNDLYQTLCLDYGNGGYSMYVLLPNKGKTINDVIRSLSTQKLEQHRQMTIKEVDILLPCFTTKSEIGLTGVLSAMGMPRAFGTCAEFPNMAQGHINDLYVSMMKQKAKIEVAEKGTKAAAITIAEVCVMSIELDVEKLKTVEFHAKRPFVYYIVENSTGTIFFMGTYCGD